MMNRRDFLKLTGATVGTLALLPIPPADPNPTTCTLEPWEPIPSMTEVMEEVGRSMVAGMSSGLQRGQIVYMGEDGRLLPAQGTNQPLLGIATRDLQPGEVVTMEEILVYGELRF